MQRIKHLFALAVRSFVSSHDDAVADYFNSIDVRLDGRRLERVPTRRAIAIVVPGRRLVLVDLADFAHLRIERAIGQLQRMLSLLGQTLADGCVPAGDRALLIFDAAGAQAGVQLVQILDAGNGRCPAPLNQLHAILDMRFFVGAGWQAEQGLEVVMTRQRQPPLVQLPLAALKDRRRHGPRIVPPKLLGDGAEELHRTNGPVQNGLRLFARQGDRERGARPGPRDDQKRNLPSSLRKVAPDVAEVRLGPLARIARQRKKRLPPLAATTGYVAADLVVAAPIRQFALEASTDLRRRVTLLPRGAFVLAKYLVDPLLVLFAQHATRPRLAQRIRPGLRPLERLPDLPPRVMKRAGDLANAHPVAMGATNPSIVFHRQHP